MSYQSKRWNRNFDPRKARCFNCKKVGHVISTCRLPKQGRSGSSYGRRY